MSRQSATWRRMRKDDLSWVVALADNIHPDLPEDVAVFESRLAVFPEGALVLETDGVLAGYAFAHPVAGLSPPPLNTVLASLPESADALYLHDLAIAPSARGRGLARPALDRLCAAARDHGLARVCLVSVYGTAPYWSRFGFEPAPGAVPAAKLASYGEAAVFMIRKL